LLDPSVLDALPDALLLVDLRGFVRYANTQAAALFGASSSGEMVGLSVEAFVPEAKRAAHAGLRARYAAAPSPRAMGARRQLTALRRDGGSVPVDISLSPLERGGERFTIVVVRDTTDARHVAEEGRLRSVAIQAAANGIAVTDLDGRFTWVNDAFCTMTGYAVHEILGQQARLLRSGKHDEAFYQAMWGTILRGEVWHGETTNKKKDGSLYVEEQTIAPVLDEERVITHFIAIKQDITARRQAEAEIQARVHELELLHRLSFLDAPDASIDALVARAEPILREALGAREVMLSSPGRGFDPPPLPGALKVRLHAGGRDLGALHVVFDGEATRGAAILPTAAAQIAGAIERARLVAELREQATRDPLTGVLNRRALFARLEIEIERAHRYGHPLSLLMLDLDHFKRINDDHGHPTGDAALVLAARTLASRLRATDAIGRFGGEEFVILMPETPLHMAVGVADRMRMQLATAELVTEMGRLFVTVSFGAAEYDGRATADELIACADAALYEAKAEGRDRVSQRSFRP